MCARSLAGCLSAAPWALRQIACTSATLGNSRCSARHLLQPDGTDDRLYAPYDIAKCYAPELALAPLQLARSTRADVTAASIAV